MILRTFLLATFVYTYLSATSWLQLDLSTVKRGAQVASLACCDGKPFLSSAPLANNGKRTSTSNARFRCCHFIDNEHCLHFQIIKPVSLLTLRCFKLFLDSVITPTVSRSILKLNRSCSVMELSVNKDISCLFTFGPHCP
jgi:hypothetical protein